MTVATCRLTLKEWECRRPEPHSGLEGRSLESSAQRALAETLARTGMLEVTELRAGLMVRSFSHVGSVRLGSVDITVEPKIDQSSLLSLVRYAYGFRRLKLLPEAAHRLDRTGFADLLVSQLLAEVGELLARGLHRSYVPMSNWLSTPRGRIDLQRLASRTGVLDAALPCTYHPRVEDTLINQVLLAGLDLAGSVASDLMLRRESRRMETILGESVTPTTLNADLLDRGTRGLNRLTSAYEPALALIRLLWQSHGVSLSEGQLGSNLPGFLFDMNRFFQALLSRFLRDNLPGCTVRDEHHLRGMMQYAPGYNPRNRRPPVPRPDFVILRENRPVAVLDAKYRDLWDNPLPRDMLYQLAIYAVGHEQRAATILYPTTDAAAQEARIGVTEPLFGRHLAQVCLRPVVMQKLGELIASGQSASAQRRGTAYAEWLVTGEESASHG